MKSVADSVNDGLIALAFAAIAAAITPHISPTEISLLAYAWLGSVVLAIAMIVRMYVSYRSRPFSRRFKSEEEAQGTLRSLLRGATNRVCVLSKVGTSIFFSFPDYSQRLEQGVKIEVIVVDPDDHALITLMDKIYVEQKQIATRWGYLISQIRTSLDQLRREEQVSDEVYTKVRSHLDPCNGYGDLIRASILMWEHAEQCANQRLSEQSVPISVHGLDLRKCTVLPDIKAWIFDTKQCMIGNYDALHLGRDNPVDLYRPGPRTKLETWQFENIVAVWDHKYGTSVSI